MRSSRAIQLAWLRFVGWSVLLAALLWSLNHRFGLVPPLGPFFSPFQGVWAKPPSPLHAKELGIPGLKAAVQIQLDSDRVPHIFAENDEDLYLAQGFVVASERLWQMEFITRVASGRLSEIMGDRALEYDRFFIKLGLPDAAKESSQMMLQDPVTAPALRSYTQGVNAYITSLKPSSLPFEYKLLGHQPEAWTPQKAALLLKFMAYNLSGLSRDLAMTRTRAKLDPMDFLDLFPLLNDAPEPIVPKNARIAEATLAIPPAPSRDFLPDLKKLDPVHSPDPGNGSNNWAVMGKKSTTGLPILSNDIHLGLNVPSLWYEIQLSSPTHNVYGVTLPGSPGVILGFNSKLAWGVTNGTSDILDWYELRYRDEKKSEYLFDGEWRPVISQEYEIPVRAAPMSSVLVRRTHFGPIVYDESESPINKLIPRGLAMRWAALDPSNELKSFLLLNRALSTKACREAIETYQSPDQNFLCADASGDVGIWHMGRYPLRWPGQGRWIGDGTSGEWSWKGWVPREEVPYSRNPERGFLSSANQVPAAEAYPYDLGGTFEEPFRAIRINELLREKDKFSPEDLMQMQGDTLSVPARILVPKLLASLAEVSLDEREKLAFEWLKSWDFRYQINSAAATVYHEWVDLIYVSIWSERLPDRSDYLYPSLWRTIRLITTDPNSKYFDKAETLEKENFSSHAVQAFRGAILNLVNVHGDLNQERLRWARVRKTEFSHMGRIPGLGVKDVPAPGTAYNIYANTGVHGPVWKMVVALDKKKPRAWGVYPGGQSGDPRSPHYDNFISTWSKNEFRELIYLQSASEKSPRAERTLKLVPQGANK